MRSSWETILVVGFLSTIHIRMHYGMIRKLNNVRYVPDINGNIISLGALASEGLKVTIKEGFSHDHEGIDGHPDGYSV